jgi:Ca2+-binding RTX toxin-like protein
MLRRLLPAAATGAFAALVLPAGAAAAATATLAQGTLTIGGDVAADTIGVRAGGGDAIAVDLDGDGGTDASFARAAVDLVDVVPGAGNDRVTIGDGLGGEAIVVDGGPGGDVLIGGDGGETFSWSPGGNDDMIDGSAGDDVLEFNASNASEVVSLDPTGAPGHVRVFRNVANVTLDLVRIDRLSVRLLGGGDTFTAAAAGIADALPQVEVNGGDGIDTLTGGDEADTLSGGLMADTLNGGGGDDRFPVGVGDTGANADAIDGGPGDDTLAVTGSDARETYTISAPAAGQVTVAELAGATAFTATLERAPVDALGGDDDVTANAPGVGVDARGGDGDDRLIGNDAADRLDGGAGRDVLRGGAGSDVLLGGPGTDSLTGAAGADRFACAGVGDTLDATAEDVVDPDCLAPPPPAAPATVTVTQVVPGPPAPGTAADTRAPVVRLLGLPATIRRAALLRSGLRFRVSADERAALTGELLGTARGARIAAANLTLARRALPAAAAGTRTIALKPSRRLVGSAKRFTLTVRVVATDAAGNRRTAQKTVRVR